MLATSSARRRARFISCALTVALSAGAAEVKQASSGVEIHVAPEHRRPIDTVVRLGLDGPAGSLPPR